MSKTFSKSLLSVLLICGLVFVGCEKPADEDNEDTTEEVGEETSSNSNLAFEAQMTKDGLFTSETLGYSVQFPDYAKISSVGDSGIYTYSDEGVSLSFEIWSIFDGETLSSHLEDWQSYYDDPEYYQDLEFTELKDVETNEGLEGKYVVATYTSYDFNYTDYKAVFENNGNFLIFNGNDWGETLKEEEFLNTVKSLKIN